MKDSFSIKLSREFHRAYKKGGHKGGRFLVVYAVRNNRGKSRLGITVGKKFGNSVQRNRFKRLVRESFRSVKGLINGSYDIIVTAKASERNALAGRKLRADYIPTFAEVNGDFTYCLTHIGILPKNEGDICEKSN